MAIPYSPNIRPLQMPMRMRYPQQQPNPAEMLMMMQAGQRDNGSDDAMLLALLQFITQNQNMGAQLRESRADRALREKMFQAEHGRGKLQDFSDWLLKGGQLGLQQQYGAAATAGMREQLTAAQEARKTGKQELAIAAGTQGLENVLGQQERIQKLELKEKEFDLSSAIEQANKRTPSILRPLSAVLSKFNQTGKINDYLAGQAADKVRARLTTVLDDPKLDDITKAEIADNVRLALQEVDDAFAAKYRDEPREYTMFTDKVQDWMPILNEEMWLKLTGQPPDRPYSHEPSVESLRNLLEPYLDPTAITGARRAMLGTQKAGIEKIGDILQQANVMTAETRAGDIPVDEIALRLVNLAQEQAAPTTQPAPTEGPQTTVVPSPRRAKLLPQDFNYGQTPWPWQHTEGVYP